MLGGAEERDQALGTKGRAEHPERRYFGGGEGTDLLHKDFKTASDDAGLPSEGGQDPFERSSPRKGRIWRGGRTKPKKKKNKKKKTPHKKNPKKKLFILEGRASLSEKGALSP